MNPLWKNTEFCDELFPAAPIAPHGIASQMAAIRRRKRLQARTLASCATLAVLLGALLLPGSSPRQRAAAPAWQFESRPFQDIVRSAPAENILVETDPAHSIAIVRSEDHPAPITDAELFDLFRGRAVAILRGQGEAILEFLGPDK